MYSLLERRRQSTSRTTARSPINRIDEAVADGREDVNSNTVQHNEMA
jgi:hypothetical protein